MSTHSRPKTFLCNGKTLKAVKRLGSGVTGVAYSVKDIHQNMFCIKELTMRSHDTVERDIAAKEVRIMKKFEHENVIRYIDSWYPDPYRFCILMELAPCGALEDVILKQKKLKQNLSSRMVKQFMEQLCSALDFCHEITVMHRDIKPANILVGELGVLKLADFGHSKQLESKHSLANTFAGSPLYMAPEVITNRAYSFPCDVWSMGCVLFELATLNTPWLDAKQVMPSDFAELKARVSSSDPIWARLDNTEIRPLVQQMMKRDPFQRITAKYLMKAFVLKQPAPPFDPTSVFSDPANAISDDPIARIQHLTDQTRVALLKTSAALDIQETFKESTKVRKVAKELLDAQIPNIPALVVPKPLRPIDRMPRAAPAVPKYNAKQYAMKPTALPRPRVSKVPSSDADKFKASVELVQKNFRATLNRRRNNALKAGLPSVRPITPRTAACSTRLQELATPRTVKQLPQPFPDPYQNKQRTRAGAAGLPSIARAGPRAAWM